MGSNAFSYSAAVSVGTETSDKPPKAQLPTYSMAKIELPPLNEDLTATTLLMWEAVAVKTELVGINTMVDVHTGGNNHRLYGNAGIGLPIQGLNYHFFAVGGEPLELQGIVLNSKATYPAGTVVPPGALEGQMKDSLTCLDPLAKEKLLNDGVYPIETWCPDPAKNENTRYFGNLTGGTVTPPSLQFTNTVTTLLLDENGVGPLCKGDNLYLSCADIVGFFVDSAGKMYFRGLPRYFNITLRKRIVKNPYHVSTLLNTLFASMLPKVKGQEMVGGKSQIEEVRIYEGTEPLPGDPDINRFVDHMGQTHTEIGS